MSDNLDQLSHTLLNLTSEGLTEKQTLLLRSKWPQIREIAAQNAGFRGWGKHLLKLGAQDAEALQKTFRETIRSIEGDSLDLTQAFMEAHPDLIGLKFLFDQKLKMTDVPLSSEAAKAIFWEYDPELVAQHRSQFQELFKFIGAHPTWPQRDSLVAQILIGHLIALLPYFDFEEGSIVSILRFIQGQWKIISYKVSYIPLVDHHIIAYGLEPQDAPEAKPLLIFRGTPYPAASGFFDAVWSDLHPIRSIGEDIFEQGRAHLDRWMEGKEKVECYGVSLGGALAYHAGQAYGEKVEVHAYGAPGLIPMKKGLSKIHGKVFFHLHDLVKLVGFHPESDNFEIYAMLTETEVDFVLAHVRPTGMEPTLVLKINPRHENRKWPRYLFNVAKIFVSSILYLTLLPLRLLILAFEKLVKTYVKFKNS